MPLVVLAVPLLAENRVGRTTPVALVVLLLKEDLDLTAGLMVQGHVVPVVPVVPVVLVVQEGLGLTAGHMVRVGHMVAHPSRKGDPDRTANQISTTRANQISTTRRGSASLGTRGFSLQLGLSSEVHRTSTQGHHCRSTE